MSKPVLFDAPLFHFEAVRALWYAPSGGADYGEVMGAVGRIRPGDLDSWYREWSGLAEGLAARADGLRSRLSSGRMRLRASNYMRTAEFFLEPRSAEQMAAWRFSQAQFYRGLDEIEHPYERLSIPYKGAVMEAIYLPGAGDDLLIAHGGFDSTPEELFFVLGRGAQEQGCNVLLFEGPGQGGLLRNYDMPFDPDWQACVSTAMDAALQKRSFARIFGFGWSMGGHFMSRAAAREPRLDGVILCDYYPSPIEGWRRRAPDLDGFRRKTPEAIAALEAKADTDPFTRWVLHHAFWVFGARDIPELVDRLTAFEEGAWVSQIKAHVLVMLGEKEHIFDPALADAFVARLTSAASVTVRRFTEAEGGELHCRNGAYYLLQDEIVEWISALPARGPARVAAEAAAP